VPQHPGVVVTFINERNKAGEYLYACVGQFVDDIACGGWSELTNEQRAQWGNAAFFLRLDKQNNSSLEEL
jgi:hypothetical protein